MVQNITLFILKSDINRPLKKKQSLVKNRKKDMQPGCDIGNQVKTPHKAVNVIISSSAGKVL